MREPNFWRRRLALNPWYGFPNAPFRGESFQPLSHLSAVIEASIVAERLVCRQCTSGQCATALGGAELILCNSNERRWHGEAHGLKCVLLAAFCEERLEDGGAVVGEDAGGDFDVMVEARVGEDFEAGADGAAFGIVGAVDEAGDTGLGDSGRAHAATRGGDGQRGISEALGSEKAGG